MVVENLNQIVLGQTIFAGYGATCECMVQSAIVILQETARWLSPMFDHIGDTFLANSIFLPRLPSAGGVYSPGYAFADTTLVSRFPSSFHAMNVAVDMCPNIENCTLQKDLGKWESPNILAAIFLFPQVEQKGRDIHICGRGYLI